MMGEPTWKINNIFRLDPLKDMQDQPPVQNPFARNCAPKIQTKNPEQSTVNPEVRIRSAYASARDSMIGLLVLSGLIARSFPFSSHGMVAVPAPYLPNTASTKRCPFRPWNSSRGPSSMTRCLLAAAWSDGVPTSTPSVLFMLLMAITNDERMVGLTTDKSDDWES